MVTRLLVVNLNGDLGPAAFRGTVMLPAVKALMMKARTSA
jgi:hypothetical protein